MSGKPADRIEETIFLRVPRERVWRALADAKEFGSWFGVALKGAFAPGAVVKGSLTVEGYEGVPCEIAVERLEPPKLFAWRWHPYAVERGRDYSGEKPTLVVWELSEKPGGTLVTVVESGFDGLPEARRAEAYREHREGWAWQMKAIEGHLAKAA